MAGREMIEQMQFEKRELFLFDTEIENDSAWGLREGNFQLFVHFESIL